MNNQVSVLAIAIFAAPYRSSLFSFFSKHLRVDGFYERDNDYGRVNDFFSEQGFTVLNNKDNRKSLLNKLKNINQYDVILLYDYTSPLSRRIMRKALLHKIPYIINCDGVIIGKKRNIVANIVKRFYVKRASKCFASGKYAKKYFLDLGAKEENVIIHNFTTLDEKDILSNPLSTKEKNVIRTKYGLPINKTIFVGVGRFISIKNYEFLLNNCDAFTEKSCLLLIGGGEQEDLYKSIIEQHKTFEVILKGFLDKTTLFDVLSSCDYFIHPTLYDAWGLVINEAMARGLPIISSNTCVAALELVDETNGFIFDYSSFFKTIEMAEHLFSNKHLYNNCCENSINKIKKFTVKNMGEIQLDAILEVSKSKK